MLSLYTNLAVRLQRNEKGATAVEYGIMVGLIAVVIIVAVSLLGGSLNAMFEQVQCQVGGGTWTPTAADADSSVGGSCAYPAP
jgi:pilus assembly protein Flp/PilA